MDARVLIPRTRRAIDGPTASGSAAVSASLTDDQMVALIADAIADVIFYTGGAWGHTLEGSDADSYGAPTEFTVTPDLDLAEQTVVIAQAALNYYFHQVKDATVSETIENEAQSWTITKSANLLVEHMKLLREMRDKALDQISTGVGALETYVSFIAVRDAATSRVIEPYIDGALALGGGQEYDPRFR